MAIALFPLPHLFQCLQSVLDWLSPARQRHPRASKPAVMAAGRGPRPAAARPLRVVRVLDPGFPRTVAGRMVISGRLADVCAELDRLAAEEAHQRCAPSR